MQLTTEDDRPITTEAASAFLNSIGYPISPATLETKRSRGGGPIYLKASTRVLYRPSALRAWAASHMRELENTSQQAA
jgi:hypothetical protein